MTIVVLSSIWSAVYVMLLNSLIMSPKNFKYHIAKQVVTYTHYETSWSGLSMNVDKRNTRTLKFFGGGNSPPFSSYTCSECCQGNLF